MAQRITLQERLESVNQRDRRAIASITTVMGKSIDKIATLNDKFFEDSFVLMVAQAVIDGYEAQFIKARDKLKAGKIPDLRDGHTVLTERQIGMIARRHLMLVRSDADIFERTISVEPFEDWLQQRLDVLTKAGELPAVTVTWHETNDAGGYRVDIRNLLFTPQ